MANTQGVEKVRVQTKRKITLCVLVHCAKFKYFLKDVLFLEFYLFVIINNLFFIFLKEFKK